MVECVLLLSFDLDNQILSGNLHHLNSCGPGLYTRFNYNSARSRRNLTDSHGTTTGNLTSKF